MRRSGVSPAVKRSKLSREMLRRAASGRIEATQLSKFAAASRIAEAVIRGWPEAPSSPLQGRGAPLAFGAVCACAGVVEFCPEKMLPNRLEIPPLACASAAPARSRTVAITTAAVSIPFNGSIACFMPHPLHALSGFQEALSRFPTV